MINLNNNYLAKTIAAPQTKNGKQSLKHANIKEMTTNSCRLLTPLHLNNVTQVAVDSSLMCPFFVHPEQTIISRLTYKYNLTSLNLSFSLSLLNEIIPVLGMAG